MRAYKFGCNRKIYVEELYAIEAPAAVTAVILNVSIRLTKMFPFRVYGNVYRLLVHEILFFVSESDQTGTDK